MQQGITNPLVAATQSGMATMGMGTAPMTAGFAAPGGEMVAAVGNRHSVLGGARSLSAG